MHSRNFMLMQLTPLGNKRGTWKEFLESHFPLPYSTISQPLSLFLTSSAFCSSFPWQPLRRNTLVKLYSDDCWAMPSCMVGNCKDLQGVPHFLPVSPPYSNSSFSPAGSSYILMWIFMSSGDLPRDFCCWRWSCAHPVGVMNLKEEGWWSSLVYILGSGPWSQLKAAVVSWCWWCQTTWFLSVFMQVLHEINQCRGGEQSPAKTERALLLTYDGGPWLPISEMQPLALVQKENHPQKNWPPFSVGNLKVFDLFLRWIHRECMPQALVTANLQIPQHIFRIWPYDLEMHGIALSPCPKFFHARAYNGIVRQHLVQESVVYVMRVTIRYSWVLPAYQQLGYHLGKASFLFVQVHWLL